MLRYLGFTLFILLLSTVPGCDSARKAGDHEGHDRHTSTSGGNVIADDPSLPADATNAVERLKKSTRHGEWANVTMSTGDSIRMWVVYPEKDAKTPVVIVIHEIFGLSNWVRAVADQLAADGFIAIAPDLLTMQHLSSTPEGDPIDATKAIANLKPEQVHQQLEAVAKYGLSLPAASTTYGVVGFCWGGAAAFNHAVMTPTLAANSLGASVVYYGRSPSGVEGMRVPVLGLYGGNDARVTSTIPPADSAARKAGKTFEYYIYPGAGHGFLRQQLDTTGSNLKATKEAWPATLAWFRKYLK
jgi:carboxymethylenebutenolidase